MSIGVLSGTAKGEIIEIVFESYYQSSDGDNSLFAEWLTQKTGLSFVNSSKSDSFKVITFDNLQRDAAGRWATHEIIGQDNKPLLEFLGPGLTTLTFSIFLSSFLGVTPAAELEKLRKLRDKGVICDFIIGSSAVGENKWVVQNVSEALKNIDGSGNIIVAAVNLTLQEYPKLPGEE